MKNRKVLAIITALAMVFASFSVSFAAEETTEPATTSAPVFTDVTDHWGQAAIGKWAGFGIINGYEGYFRPDDSITRGEMAVILDNMMDYQAVAQNTFWDLPAGQFYTDAILKANAAGIMLGYDGSVRPADKITKEEAAIMMTRAFAVAEASSTKALLDASAISDWAKGAVFGLEAKGYISGYAGYYNPKASITRAEVVTIVDNIVKAYYTAAGAYTDDVTGTAVIKVTGVTLNNATVTGNLIIAEGVGQGEVTLNNVTVKGELVVRGGGENSVHITGNSNITKVSVEKVGDKIRIVVSDGSTVNVVEVEAGEEIIISGTVGTLQVDAPSVTISTQNANISNVNINGAGTTLNVDSQTTIKTVSSTAETTVTGTGKVTNVVLNEGADGSKITTPNTKTTVGAGVTGVTGGGGTAIPPGSTGTNNSSGTGASVTTGSSGGSGGGGGGDDTPSVTFNFGGVTISGIYTAYNNLPATVPVGWTSGSGMTVAIGGANIPVSPASLTVRVTAYSDAAHTNTFIYRDFPLKLDPGYPTTGAITFKNNDAADNTGEYVLDGFDTADITEMLGDLDFLRALVYAGTIDDVITIRVLNTTGSNSISLRIEEPTGP